MKNEWPEDTDDWKDLWRAVLGLIFLYGAIIVGIINWG